MGTGLSSFASMAMRTHEKKGTFNKFPNIWIFFLFIFTAVKKEKIRGGRWSGATDAGICHWTRANDTVLLRRIEPRQIHIEFEIYARSLLASPGAPASFLLTQRFIHFLFGEWIFFLRFFLQIHISTLQFIVCLLLKFKTGCKQIWVFSLLI